jgi:hypothetical protein
MIFTTKGGSKVEILEGNLKMGLLWVNVHPDNKDKSFFTHIKLSDIKEGVEEVEKFLEKKNSEV